MSYISKWRFQDFENISRNYFGKVGDPEFNFNELFESFCSEAGVDDFPNINADQRIIIVGSSVREKLGSVALWLRDHNIDIKLIEVLAYKEDENLFIEPSTIVPMPVSRFIDVGKPGAEGQPWTADGRSWHLEKRCSPKTNETLLLLDQILQDEFELEGPRWNQKSYVAYPVNNYNWLCVYTKPRFLLLHFLVKAGVFKIDELAKRLSVEQFDAEESLSDKLGMPSSIFVKNRNPSSDKIILRAKEDFDVKSDSFIEFLRDAFKAFPK